MRALSWMIVFLVFVWGCKNNKPIDNNIIGKDTLIQIMADMHILEASMSLGHIETDTILNRQENFYLGIFDKHKVTKDRFDSSWSYYILNPEEFNKMYIDIVNELSMRQAHADAK